MGVYEDEKTEAEILQVENDVLRRKLTRMELKLEDLELAAQQPPASGRERGRQAIDIDDLVNEARLTSDTLASS